MSFDSIRIISKNEILPEYDLGLDLGLQSVLCPPELPVGFRSRLMDIVMQQSIQDVQAQKRAFELEYAQGQERLRRGYLRMQQSTLTFIVIAAFALGAVAHIALPWLQEAVGIDMSASVAMLALAIGLLVNRGDWLDHVKQRVWTAA